MCCAGMALSQWQHTLWGNRQIDQVVNGACKVDAEGNSSKQERRYMCKARVSGALLSSQRSLHSAPIFRLLLKVAVNGTHQCDFHNF